MSDGNDWNTRIIEEFRANHGKVGGQFEGAPLLLLHTTGAKSGNERVNPVMYLADGDNYAVFASKGGAPTNPDWYHNLIAHPKASTEVGDPRSTSLPTSPTLPRGVDSGRDKRSCTPASPSTRPRRRARSR